ncbi:speckle-type POZ protein B [Nasonia vitripennis]|uniref:BTB domain-containing protein n=1 Tax=Nasonia vitripennis TaxID=7425 RepID=A0A7M7IRL7_NASVI|nr:speckle-type POZ protein B [Nasonia vitripennis]
MSGAVKESAFIPLLILVLFVASSVNCAIISESWSSTKFEELILNHTCIVNNFDQIYTLEYINSPEFWPPNYENFKWYIRLYPCQEGHILFQLYHNESSTVNVNYTLSVGFVVRTDSNVFRGVDFRSFSHFMSRQEVFNHIQPNGDLLINCEIRKPIKVLISTGSGRTIDSYTSANNQTCTSKIHNELANLLEDEKYGNVTIVIEGNKIRAHRNILAVQSPAFASLLMNSSTSAQNCNCNSSSIEIKDVEFEVFRKLLGLQAMCGEILCSNLNGINAVEILLIADQQNMPELKLCTSKFIAVVYAPVNTKINNDQ